MSSLIRIISSSTLTSPALFFFFFFPFSLLLFFFFFNAPATTEIYTLSLHDALPICALCSTVAIDGSGKAVCTVNYLGADRKSTRLNSSHRTISYAVFCLKKKKKKQTQKIKRKNKKKNKQPIHIMTCI